MDDVQATAAALAADLAGDRIDPNEAQKALAYLRARNDSDQFFAYLDAIVRDGRAVIRSRQTLDYYRALQVVCERHLRGMDAEEMAQSLGWAIRLLRYYRAVPDAEIVRPTVAPRMAPSAPPKPEPRPARIPEPGDIFTGTVLEVNAAEVVVEVPKIDQAVALAIMPAAALDGRTYQKNNLARVEVVKQGTLPNGTVVLLVKPAPKKQK